MIELARGDSMDGEQEDFEKFFLTLLIESEVEPLSQEERRSIKIALKEYQKGETVKWEDIETPDTL